MKFKETLYILEAKWLPLCQYDLFYEMVWGRLKTYTSLLGNNSHLGEIGQFGHKIWDDRCFYCVYICHLQQKCFFILVSFMEGHMSAIIFRFHNL